MTSDSDEGFTPALKHLLGVDEDQMKRIIMLLSAEDMINFTDAVMHKDKATCIEIIKNARANERMNETNVFEASDDMDINESLVLDGSKYTINIIKGLGKAVQIAIKENTTMVKKNQQDEATMGIMPSINRMRQLSGIHGIEEFDEHPMDTSFADEEADYAFEPEPTSAPILGNFGVPVTPYDPAKSAMEALDMLQAALPSVRLSDLTSILKRIFEITEITNESLTYKNKSIIEMRRKK